MKPGCLARLYAAGPLPAVGYEYPPWDTLEAVKKIALIEE